MNRNQTQINLYRNGVENVFRFNGAYIYYGNKAVRTARTGQWYDNRHDKIMKLLHELENELYELWKEELK